MTILKLNLVGPMQSYGVRGRWDYKDTLQYPTKSAVVGMLGCALGIPRERLEEISSKIKVHIRINKEGKIAEDYQIREYKTTEGIDETKKDKKTDKFVLHKSYLYDASFTVYVEGDLDFLNDCYKALLDPVWNIFLGRKSCVPSMPLVGSYEESVYTDVCYINHFIEQDTLSDGMVKEGYLRYFIEQDFLFDDIVIKNGSMDGFKGDVILSTQTSNFGQKFYKKVRLCEYIKKLDDAKETCDVSGKD